MISSPARVDGWQWNNSRNLSIHAIRRFPEFGGVWGKTAIANLATIAPEIRYARVLENCMMF
jgi:hypothetical protein